MKRICITGAGGMIGTALTEYALAQDVAVLALVRPGGKRPNAHPLLTVAESDLSALDTFQSDLPCDAFVHLSWAATFGGARDDTSLQVKNIAYTLDAVHLAQRLGCSAFVSVGSQAEYGLQKEPLRPDTPCEPLTGYGIAKLAAGKLSRLLCGQLGLRHCHVRILSVYGGRDRDATLISTCVDTMLRGEAPELTTCTQMWDYLYEKDAARALFLTAEKGRDGAVYPLGGGECRPLAEYVLEIQKATGCPVPPLFGARQFPKNQVQYLCADLSAITADTDFVPQVPFAEGIRQTICTRKEKITA